MVDFGVALAAAGVSAEAEAFGAAIGLDLGEESGSRVQDAVGLVDSHHLMRPLVRVVDAVVGSVARMAVGDGTTAVVPAVIASLFARARATLSGTAATMIGTAKVIVTGTVIA